MTERVQLSPVLKWVGGKRQLLEELSARLPAKLDKYCEPFVGGGALLFHLQPHQAIINDVNAELINLYSVIKSDVAALIRDLQKHRNEEAYFYSVRDWDRDRRGYARRSAVRRASRLLYLNRTCYNGLYRVNSAGEFNAPFGKYKNPNMVNAPLLTAVSRYFNTASVELCCTDYYTLLDKLDKSFFVYLDPPYDPVSPTASFTSYARQGFGREEQMRLRDFCRALDSKGVKFMLSNAATPFIREIYAGFDIDIVQARRAINSVGSKRGAVEEVVVRNYA